MDWHTYRTYHKEKFGTTTYAKLSADYTKQKPKSQRSPQRSPKKLNLDKVKKNLPMSRKYKHAALDRVIRHKSEGRGSATRGWAAASPQKSTERHNLKQVCGNQAFLAENEKYPVMNALRNTGGKCEYVCEAIQSAKNRSCQYDRPDVAAKANKLGVKHCGWSAERASPCKPKTRGAGPAR